MKPIFTSLLAVFLLVSSLMSAQTRIAVIADPHIMDVTGHPELVRSMADQVTSTRLFNENIFAFKATLDDIASKDIDLVIIVGDLTDDGQVLNQECARNILAQYSEKYGMRFFLTPGNHDPKEPFGRKMSSLMLSPDGSVHAFVSEETADASDATLLPELRSVGHTEQMACYWEYGYSPRKDDLYWETPFSSYNVDTWSYDKAMVAADPQNRSYVYADGICDIDMSYLVEPVGGLWVLSIDCGVYLPRKDGRGYENSSPGYNNTLQHKPYLIPWVRKVVAEAEAHGKSLVAFCHFPAADFHDGATGTIVDNWKKGAMNTGRIPYAAVMDSLAATGLRCHFAGHLHIDDVSTHSFGDKILTNIQVPSIATGIPAYKIVTTAGTDCLTVETVTVREAPGFDSLFPLYRKERKYARKTGHKVSWDPAILKSRDYAELCDRQFRDLVRLRFCREDLPEELSGEFLGYTGARLMSMAGGRPVKGMKSWTGYDLILDTYRFYYSGQLARGLVPQSRIDQYELLFDAVSQHEDESAFQHQLHALGVIFHALILEK